MRKINRLIIHCTATPHGREVTVSDIDRWHRARGFDCIGYHYVIYPDGSVHPGRDVGRIGAHCRGYNTGSIGIAYVGGLTPDGITPADTRTAAQRESLRALVTQLRTRYPGATVHGHNEFAAKACPCFDVGAEFPGPPSRLAPRNNRETTRRTGAGCLPKNISTVREIT